MNKEYLISFLQHIDKFKDDNGIMANFRKCREPELEHYSYGKLIPWCNGLSGKTDDNKKKTIFFLAWCFAIYKRKEYRYKVNFGEAMKILRGDISENTVDRLFNCVCSSGDTDELLEYMERIIQMCEAKDIKIDLVNLGMNIFYWDYGNNEKTKLIWAEECYC